jgi:hypothetical protein
MSGAPKTAGRYVPKAVEGNAGGVFELRHYRIVPEHFAAYMKLGAEMHKHRVQHSQMAGYWVPEMGGQNEVVHMWPFSSLEHRREVRAACAKDQGWQGEYLKPTRHMVQHQTNQLLVPVDAPPTATRSTDHGKTFFYHMRHEAVAGDGSVGPMPAGAHVQLCGQWLTAVGPAQQKVTLTRSTELDALLEAVVAAAPAEGTTVQGRLLYVAPHAKLHGATWQ